MKYFLLTGVTFVLLILSGLIRAWEAQYEIYINYVLFVIYGMLWAKFNRTRWAIIHIPISILLLVATVWVLEGSQINGLYSVAHHILASMAGFYIYFNSKVYIRLSTLSCSAIICYLSSTRGVELWENYSNYRHFSNSISVPLKSNWEKEILGIDDSSIALKEIYFLDFFNTHCPPCIATFKSLDSIYLSTLNHPELGLYAVEIPFETDTLNQGKQLVSNKGYKFPVVTAPKGIEQKLGFLGVPTTIVIKNDTIVYVGAFEQGKVLLSQLLANDK